jgi:hypothetical protein
MRSVRYHIEMTIRGKTTRTTISLDNMLSELLELKLGGKPGTTESHTLGREWLQKKYDEEVKTGQEESRWFRREVLLLVTDKGLREKWMKI